MTEAYGAAPDGSDLTALARGVRRWAEAAADSPLYAYLARRVAADPELLAVVARMDNVPPMNLLLGGVKLRLAAHEPLAAWYPNLAGDAARAPDDAGFRAFRDYVLRNAEALIEIGATRRTQTNEVGRAAAVLPWLSAAARRWGEPLHLVDIGAAAGLNLCMDRFDYRYLCGRDETRLASSDPAAVRLTLTCEMRGGVTAPVGVPRVASRTGLELSPVDPADPEQRAWLEALVWPEHADRLTTLRAALDIRRRTRVDMRAGDASRTLPEVLAALPDGPVAVIHTVMAYQLTDAQRAALDEACVEAAGERPLVRVGLEPWSGSPHPRVTVGASQRLGKVVASAQAHGRWLAPPERQAR